MNADTKKKIEEAAKEHFSYNEGDTWLAFKRGATLAYSLATEEKEAEIAGLKKQVENFAMEMVVASGKISSIESALKVAVEALELSIKKDGCACDVESTDGHHLYVCYKHQALQTIRTMRREET